jgi:2-methylcitrate dehydratase PrpD
MAAELAARGWTGAADIIDHPLGFIPSFCGDAGDVDAIVKSLGNPFTIQNTIVIKKYPCGAGNHPTIDSILELMKEHHFDYRDVDEVELQQSYQSDYVLYAKPRTGLEGKFSVLYNAAAPVQGTVRYRDFHRRAHSGHSHSRNDDKIRIRILTRWDEWEEKAAANGPTDRPGLPAKPVRVRLKDGRVLVKSTAQRNYWASTQPVGHGEYPGEV